ncbi:hypothetical protein LUZ61_014309 [Rhynchospora tenuis]|uniref:protein-serine/threonine phosphatase n=1 Tax=Rhynchospora tenuis TaxID=198213 RepID=A0AAD5Z118_9POAL|nr:hypothetical protein LUZ61_014309 [Rhynchospora tenuis]
MESLLNPNVWDSINKRCITTERGQKDGEDHKLKFGSSYMLDRRSTLFAAHTAELDAGKETSFFGVFDGRGGNSVALFCAHFVYKETMELVRDSGNDDLAEAIKKSFARVDEKMKWPGTWIKLQNLKGVWQNIPKKPNNWMGPLFEGSTACVAALRKNELIVGNVGDSRCVLSRNKQAIDLSLDHKPELAAERDRILQAGGNFDDGKVDGRLRYSRGIGFMYYKQDEHLPAEQQIITCVPDINKIDIINEDEFLILASNAIWNHMTSQQLVDFVHENINNECRLSGLCKKVLDICVSPDDMLQGYGLESGRVMILVQFKKHDQLPAASSSLST